MGLMKKPQQNAPNHALSTNLALIQHYLGHYNVGSAEELFLLHGKVFVWRPVSTSCRKGTLKHCYDNAYELANRQGLVYCEGVALRGFPIPFPHAWCLDADGFVVDPTWPDPQPNEERIYFGVAFLTSFVTKLRNKSGQACISDDGSGRCPVNAWFQSAESVFKNPRQQEKTFETASEYPADLPQGS
jgi:hypothetical protein